MSDNNTTGSEATRTTGTAHGHDLAASSHTLADAAFNHVRELEHRLQEAEDEIRRLKHEVEFLRIMLGQLHAEKGGGAHNGLPLR